MWQKIFSYVLSDAITKAPFSALGHTQKLPPTIPNANPVKIGHLLAPKNFKTVYFTRLEKSESTNIST